MLHARPAVVLPTLLTDIHVHELYTQTLTRSQHLTAIQANTPTPKAAVAVAEVAVVAPVVETVVTMEEAGDEEMGVVASETRLTRNQRRRGGKEKLKIENKGAYARFYHCVFHCFIRRTSPCASPAPLQHLSTSLFLTDTLHISLSCCTSRFLS
jgi:hypothetical protein